MDVDDCYFKKYTEYCMLFNIRDSALLYEEMNPDNEFIGEVIKMLNGYIDILSDILDNQDLELKTRLCGRDVAHTVKD